MSEVLPRVTDIIAAAGILPDYERYDPNRKGIAKGTAVDIGCQLLFQGYKVKELEVDPRIVPELTSLELWIKSTGFMALAWQEEVTSIKYGYRGHLDVRDIDTVIDTKVGSPAKWHRLQTMAYYVAANECNDKDVWVKRRGSLYLKKDGSIAHFKEHTDKGDWGAFLSALRLYQTEQTRLQYLENIKRWLEAA